MKPYEWLMRAVFVQEPNDLLRNNLGSFGALNKKTHCDSNHLVDMNFYLFLFNFY